VRSGGFVKGPKADFGCVCAALEKIDPLVMRIASALRRCASYVYHADILLCLVLYDKQMSRFVSFFRGADICLDPIGSFIFSLTLQLVMTIMPAHVVIGPVHALTNGNHGQKNEL